MATDGVACDRKPNGGRKPVNVNWRHTGGPAPAHPPYTPAQHGVANLVPKKRGGDNHVTHSDLAFWYATCTV